MKISSETKFFIGMLAATVTIIGIAAFTLSSPAKPITVAKDTLLTTDTHTKGNKEAKVYLVEFSDFECPSCRSFSSVVQKLTDTHKDNLYFAYRHFPLTQHKYALPAAYAAEAAAKQGKFWEAESILFENQDKFSDDFFSTQFATLIQLDKSKYDSDRNSGAIHAIVDNDFNTANMLNLPGTPTFFLNGVMLKELTGPQDLIHAVETALK
jgi:protein-disulfide isomerase